MAASVNNSIWLAVVLWHVIYHMIVAWPVVYCLKLNPVCVPGNFDSNQCIFMVIAKRNRILITWISIVRVCSLDLIYKEQRKSTFLEYRLYSRTFLFLQVSLQIWVWVVLKCGLNSAMYGMLQNLTLPKIGHGQPRVIIWTIYDELLVLHIQVSSKLFHWLHRKRFLKRFYHIWAWRPSWSCDHPVLINFFSMYPKEYIKNMVKNGPVVSEKKKKFQYHIWK